VITITTVIALGCNDSPDSGATAITSATPVTVPSSEPSATAFPGVPPSAAALSGCPLTDAAVCEFAIQLQDALNASDLAFLTQRLAPQVRPCRDTIHALEEDVGCETTEGMSAPVVTLLRFQGDCCATRPENFERQLSRWMSERDNGEPWRLYGVVADAPLWDGGAEILLVQGSSEDAPTIGAGASKTAGEIHMPGAIIGSRNALYISPAEQLLPWR
jgi:hypothetical protein